MSATVDATIFSSYFGNCPVVKVEGRTFPVKTFYLEDIYEMLDYHLASDSSAAIKNTSTKMSKNARLRNIVKSSRGRQNLVQYGWDDDEVVDEEAINPHFDELLYQSYSVTTKNSLRKLNEDVIDFDLLEELIIYIDKTGEKGAILVFLPGMGDILSLINRLVLLEHFRGALSDWILPLHSSVSTSEQHKVFQVPPSGVRKVGN
ncbi:hypothetical protein KP509_1Z321000 [Ceratopteris richardii]|nr:hypothetical protein KP509_1Z321000 [Ceratopteris richardii]